ncbi:MAG: ATP-binding protein [Pseudomonadota bacterium]
MWELLGLFWERTTGHGRSRALRDLDSFEEYHNAENRLRRYTVSRLRLVHSRCTLNCVDAGLVALVASPWLGLIAILINLPFEIAEAIVLRRELRKGTFSATRSQRNIRMVTIGQAIGISIPLILIGTHAPELRLLAWAYLFASVTLTMFAAHYYPEAHKIRMATLLTSAGFILLYGPMSGQITLGQFTVELIAFWTLGYSLRRVFQRLQWREDRMQSAERELIETAIEAKRLAVVAEHATEAVTLLDRDLKITWVNDQFTKFTGYTLEDLKGKNPGELLDHPSTDPAELKKLSSIVERGEPVSVQILNRLKDGRSVWVDIQQSPVLDENGEVVSIISVERDATERVAQKTRLRDALNSAEQAAREKTAFLSRMSHELRTPANGIVGTGDLLRETKLDADQRAIVSMLEESSGRMMRLVDDILNYSELSEGKVIERIDVVQVNSLIQGTIEEHRPAADAKSLTLSGAEICPDLSVKADGLLLRRTVNKLIGNAVKFTQNGQIKVVTQYEDGELSISVKDTGVGISPDALTRIFDQFEQADGEMTRRFDGLGLGLTMAQELARLLGGRIDVQSEEGQGSTFTLRLPVDAVDAVKPKTAHPRELRLLVAEDNRTNRLLIKKMFKGVDYVIDFAFDGVEAVEKYGLINPDIVLMDISMPNKDGISAARDIRSFELERQLPRCPIVAVTANASDLDRQKCYDAGMDGFLPKPVRKARLIEAIDQVL